MENLNEKNQIEEMANIIMDKTTYDTLWEECEASAKAIYAANYRKQEWISVGERLPEENGRYLVCVNVSHLAFTSLTIIAVMEYGKNHGFYLYSEDEPVTHWMPLPEAPKKGGAE